MANPQELLKAAKKMKTNSQSLQVENKNKINDVINSNNLYLGGNQSIDGLGYTLYPNTEQQPEYNAEDELKSIKQGLRVVNKNSKIPSVIFESIINNPLNMPVDEEVIENKVINEEVQNKTRHIINVLESRDKGKQKTQATQVENKPLISNSIDNQSIDKDEIIDILDKLLDKKFKEYINNNVIDSSMPKLKFMSLGDSFMFMDDDNNVYECKLTYKGKGKIKR